MFRRRKPPQLYAAAFASELIGRCDELAATFGGRSITLPITIPIDENGVVLLRPEGPLDAPRLPAFLGLTRPTEDAYAIRIERYDGGPMVVPGLGDAPLSGMVFTLTLAGMRITALGKGGQPVDTPVDEDTAGALATALFITLTNKLTQARGVPEA